ncbi:MAG: hypothetical protein EZS28_035667 [Streblomastix strix]|uniref:Uncharacterized protein n=1 Tax=Streblomastix strix TaxID=222440 RepID=A0A5J4UEJ3_9EUKA|nr:MAG: hypothetical protein EZS28_035667 [Streblomastix strix]
MSGSITLPSSQGTRKISIKLIIGIIVGVVVLIVIIVVIIITVVLCKKKKQKFNYSDLEKKSLLDRPYQEKA